MQIQPSSSRAVPRSGLRRAAALLAAGALAATGLLLATSPAQAVKPHGSRVELLYGSYDPSLAITEGGTTNFSQWIGRQLYVSQGADLADLGCDANDLTAEAVVATTADGSAEDPIVPDDQTGLSSLFSWSYPGQAFNAAVGVTDTDVTQRASINGLTSAAQLYTHDGWTADPQVKTTNIAKLWPAGTALSLVVVCVLPTPDASGEYIVRRGEDGRAITSWVDFVTEANPTNPQYTSEGWRIVSPKTVPSLALDADFAADGTSGTVIVKVSGDGGAALTDATGTIALYAGEDTSGTAVATAPVTAGTASLPLTGLTPGAVVSYTAVYTPDESGEATYAGATSDTTTFQVPVAAVATTTTLAVTGSLVAGQTQTLTAALSPAAATGTVAFADRGTALGTAAVSAGKATLSKSLGEGSHTLTATFTPTDPDTYAGSASAAQSVTIAAAPAPVVTLAPVSGSYGRASKARVSVTVGSAAATGSVSVKLDGASLNTAALTNGTATVTIPATTAAGTHTLVATYQGSTGQQRVVIAKARTVASVSLQPKKPTRSLTKKGKVKAMVAVAVPGTTIKATGTVTVKVGTKSVTATLSGGSVSIKLPKKLTKSATKKLAVSVTYAESSNLAASTATTSTKVKH
ncbi:Ig-like domain-containing protein [Nocardioides sp. BP30]|uniref:Ig-like domain-containing protein n=1 Tax=Nocardioides sp. BP30 TaxID=3036374 RepID=UPI0024684320|nr:Ig-like domain-containing protein [Nocardioides sp. BP30]WGL52759.1 Ig-like domain-containing protein [Nocardioides sp. BP30]